MLSVKVKAENTALKATQEPLFELQAPKKKKKCVQTRQRRINTRATKTLKGNRCNENENLGNVFGKVGDVLGVTLN